MEQVKRRKRHVASQVEIDDGKIKIFSGGNGQPISKVACLSLHVSSNAFQSRLEGLAEQKVILGDLASTPRRRTSGQTIAQQRVAGSGQGTTPSIQKRRPAVIVILARKRLSCVILLRPG